MKPQTPHTPTPWKVGAYENEIGQQVYRVLSADGKLVAHSRGAGGPKSESHANAAFIVRAVNQHESLVRENAAMRLAHEELLKLIKRYRLVHSFGLTANIEIDKLIAKAEGQTEHSSEAEGK